MKPGRFKRNREKRLTRDHSGDVHARLSDSQESFPRKVSTIVGRLLIVRRWKIWPAETGNLAQRTHLSRVARTLVACADRAITLFDQITESVCLVPKSKPLRVSIVV